MDSDSQPTARYHALDLPEMGEVLEGRYRLERVVGEGGMGLVVQAHHLRLERQVAIKLMHQHLTNNQDFVRRFKREVLIAKELEHRNTVRIYDFGETASGVMYLVMEYLDGVELKELIEQGPMSFADVHEIGSQILDGLAEAHVIDVVHRDLKPGNIHICQSRRGNRVAKILDFGIAKSLGAAQQVITATGKVVGTGPYLAPELFLEEECTKEADIYACGLVLLEMLTGRKLIDTSSMGKTMARHLHMPLILPDSLVGHPLGEVIDRALSKSLAARYDDAEAMLAALQEAADACEDSRLDATEIEAAFEQMDAAFRERAKHLLPGLDEEPTLELQEGDVEMIDSSSMSVPKTPTAPSAATTRPVMVERARVSAADEAAETKAPTAEDALATEEAPVAEQTAATQAPERATAPAAEDAPATTPSADMLGTDRRMMVIIGAAVVLVCALVVGAIIASGPGEDDATDREVIVIDDEPADQADDEPADQPEDEPAEADTDAFDLVFDEVDGESEDDPGAAHLDEAERGGDDQSADGAERAEPTGGEADSEPSFEQRPRLIERPKRPKKQPAPEADEDKDEKKSFEDILNKQLGE
jgi:eukaryotic-like serine/threonine-protein kinase